MFSSQLTDKADRLLSLCRSKKIMLATAESCTGGLIGALLTDRPGSSSVFERGFITYANEAKVELLGVPEAMLAQSGAVSEEVARQMARGAVAASNADYSVSVTGIAGPGGGSDEKPVGLVYLAVGGKNMAPLVRQCRFGDIGREKVRLATVETALDMLLDAIG